ncbi:MAG: hypothetical protein PVH88_21650 [Ignavibacteria bacterium]|jgi:hypothetical protein
MKFLFPVVSLLMILLISTSTIFSQSNLFGEVYMMSGNYRVTPAYTTLYIHNGSQIIGAYPVGQQIYTRTVRFANQTTQSYRYNFMVPITYPSRYWVYAAINNPNTPNRFILSKGQSVNIWANNDTYVELELLSSIYSFRVLVTFRGNPVPNVPVYVTYPKSGNNLFLNQSLMGYTNQNGILDFDVSLPHYGDEMIFLINFLHNNTQWWQLEQKVDPIRNQQPNVEFHFSRLQTPDARTLEEPPSLSPGSNVTQRCQQLYSQFIQAQSRLENAKASGNTQAIQAAQEAYMNSFQRYSDCVQGGQ